MRFAARPGLSAAFAGSNDAVAGAAPAAGVNFIQFTTATSPLGFTAVSTHRRRTCTPALRLITPAAGPGPHLPPPPPHTAAGGFRGGAAHREKTCPPRLGLDPAGGVRQAPPPAGRGRGEGPPDRGPLAVDHHVARPAVAVRRGDA